ncbi:MAG: NfeD family protein [Pseudomonadota bacterium]
MDTFLTTLGQLEAWHWIALGLVLIGIEVAAGTFDLLFVGIAAFATALFTAVAPGSLADWQGQMFFFAGTAIALIVLSRTVFADMRKQTHDKPGLNQRMVGMIGSRGVVTQPFAAGAGRVKIGDTEWSAETSDGSNVDAGTAIVVEGTELTVLKVKAV